jgi:hypothetical protein
MDCRERGHTLRLTPALRPAGREGRGRRLVGEQHVDLVQPAQFHHRRAVELAVVGGQPDLARVLDDGARHLHLAVVEVAQRAVGFDARDADQADVDLELADEVHRGSPTMPRSRERTTPPATMTSQSGLSDRMAATFRLLVMTRRPRWPSSSRAMASVVVPMLRISEQPFGHGLRHRARDARLACR